MSATNAPVDQSQQLERAAARTPEVITTADEFRSSVLRWQQSNLNVLTPFSNISGLGSFCGIFTTVLTFDPNPDAKEVYDGSKVPWVKPDELALAKNGLRKVAEGLGVSTSLIHLSVNQVRHYWHVKAVARYRGLDGAWIEREASMEWDLRDGSERLKGFQPKQIEEARKHGLRNCETRAINAAIRECGCGIKQVYKKTELAKPFVAVRVALRQDQNDPDVKRIVAENFFGASRALYPHAQVAAVDAFADTDDDTREPKSVGRGSTRPAETQAAQQTAATTTSTASPAADTPPCEGAVRVVDIKTTTGEKNNRKWTRFEIVDSNGESHSTFSRSIADVAEKAKASRDWVEIVVESTEDGKYKNLVEIAPAGQSPTLPGIGEL